jgi:pimeloyl-ACP methyl ester carboxylesterase
MAGNDYRGSVRRRQLWTRTPRGTCLTVVDDPADGRRPKVAVCLAHGLTGDRSGPVELLSELAAALATRCGARVVRFDATGSGESSGEFRATTFAGMADDFVAVAEAHVPPGLPLITAGISIGGVPAVQAATRLAATRRVVGVLLLSSDLIQGIRFGADDPQPIRGGEFALPGAFFREREAIRPRDELLALGVPAALVYGGIDDKLDKAATWFAETGAAVTRVDDADHLFDSSAARRVLLAACERFVADTEGVRT